MPDLPQDALRVAIAAEGLTLREAANALKCSFSHLSRVLRSEVGVSDRLASRAERRFGVPVLAWRSLRDIRERARQTGHAAPAIARAAGVELRTYLRWFRGAPDPATERSISAWLEARASC